MRRALLVPIALVVLVACGSEGQPASTATPGPAGVLPAPTARATGDPFVSAVNAACREYARKDEALAEPNDIDGYVPFWKAFIANAAELDATLAALDPPADVEGYDDYVEGNERQTDVLRAALPKIEDAVRRDDLDDAELVVSDAIEAFNAIVDELDPYAREQGFTDCESEPEAEA